MRDAHLMQRFETLREADGPADSVKLVQRAIALDAIREGFQGDDPRARSRETSAYAPS